MHRAAWGWCRGAYVVGVAEEGGSLSSELSQERVRGVGGCLIHPG